MATLREVFTDIADAIRYIKRDGIYYKPIHMADEIMSIDDGTHIDMVLSNNVWVNGKYISPYFHVESAYTTWDDSPEWNIIINGVSQMVAGTSDQSIFINDNITITKIDIINKDYAYITYTYKY